MKTAQDIASDAGNLLAVISAANFIDNENDGADSRKMRGIIFGLMQVAENLAGNLHHDLDRLAG